MEQSIAEVKRALRRELRERRSTRTRTQRENDSSALTQHLKDLVHALGAQSLSAYSPLPSEPDIRPFLDWAIDEGIRVLLPVSREDGLLDWVVATIDTTEEIGPFGVPEPSGDVLGPIAINDVDLILVPAASIDTRGTRLGWGRGYFDRTLGSMGRRPPVFAIIFSDELVDELPREAHDSPVDGAVTPTGITRFAT